MTYRSFKHLAGLLCPIFNATSGIKGTSRYCPANRPILPDVRLACAIRWFAGGSTYNIMTTYGINSYWYVVDAMAGCTKKGFWVASVGVV